jgi:hypothetical protein
MISQLKRHPRKDDQGNWLVNNSSLALIGTCFRKANYTFSNPEIDFTNEATTFGSAIHKALETYYLTPREKRTPELMKSAFDSYLASATVQIPQDGEARSVKSGHIILDAYHATYGDDSYEVFVDHIGPFVERDFEVPITPRIRFYGQIDLVLRNTINGRLYVFDHKTTAALGGFADRASPNHQLTGYIYAMKMLGHDCEHAILQGIKVTQFKRSQPEFVRVETSRTTEAIEDWVDWLTFTTNSWDNAIDQNVFPMNGGAACTAYGGCRFREVCSSKKSDQQDILNVLANKPMELTE